MEYIIYVRKSSDEKSGNQIQSIPDQIEKCIEFAEKNDLTIMKKPTDFSDFESEIDIQKEDNDADIYNRRIFQDTRRYFIVKESKSAKKPNNRKKRNRLMQYIKKSHKNGNTLGLLSYSPDRQARNMIEGGEIIELADEGVMQLKYKTFVFENTASGRMMLGFRFVFSKQYSDKLSEDIVRGNDQKLKKGKASEYKYGYKINNEGYYEPDGENFNTMKEARRMKIYDGRSNEYIATRLNAHGIRNSNGEDVQKRALSDVWKNTFYYGLHIRGRSSIDLRENDVNPYYEAMITEEQYNILQERSDDRGSFGTTQERKEKYYSITPFSSQMLITPDGYSYSPTLPNPGRFTKKLEKLAEKGIEKELRQIVEPHQIKCKCNGKKSKYNNFSFSFDLINEIMLDFLGEIKIGKKEHAEYKKFVGEELDRLLQENIEQTARLQARINYNKGARDKFITRNMGHAMDKEEKAVYEKKKKEYNKQIQLLKQQIAEIDRIEGNKELEFEAFFDILNNAQRYRKKSNYVQKRKFLDIIASNIVIDREKQVTINVIKSLQPIFGINGSNLESSEQVSNKNELVKST